MQMTSAGPAVATVATVMRPQPGSAQVAVCLTERAPLALCTPSRKPHFYNVQSLY